MRSIGKLSHRLSIVSERDAKGDSVTRPNRSTVVHDEPVSDAHPYRRYERHSERASAAANGRMERRNRLSGDRRRYVLENGRNSMPVEFRIGRDRRRTRQLGSEIVLRIDEKA